MHISQHIKLAFLFAVLSSTIVRAASTAGSAAASLPATQPAGSNVDDEKVYLLIAARDRTMSLLLKQRSGDLMSLRDLSADGMGPHHPAILRVQQELKMSRQQVSHYAALFLTNNPLFLSTPADAASSQPTAVVETKQRRNFVEIIISPAGAITFQGTETDWDQLPTLLQQLPDRSHTVLCVAASSEDVTLGQYHDAMSRSTKLVSQFGFESLSEAQHDRDQARVTETVHSAVTSISGRIEGDPKVAEALDSLKNLDESSIVAETVQYLSSEGDNMRRAAIYVLWRGNFKSINGAIDPLIQSCRHKDDLTRGMAAYALGANHAGGGKNILIEMATTDKSAYARRCAAYALGLLGDRDTLPTLYKVANDQDPAVVYNAKAAIQMLGGEISSSSRPD